MLVLQVLFLFLVEQNEFEIAKAEYGKEIESAKREYENRVKDIREKYIRISEKQSGTEWASWLEELKEASARSLSGKEMAWIKELGGVISLCSETHQLNEDIWDSKVFHPPRMSESQRRSAEELYQRNIGELKRWPDLPSTKQSIRNFGTRAGNFYIIYIGCYQCAIGNEIRKKMLIAIFNDSERRVFALKYRAELTDLFGGALIKISETAVNLEAREVRIIEVGEGLLAGLPKDAQQPGHAVFREYRCEAVLEE